MSKKVEKALQFFQQGFNCSQAVIAAFVEDFGYDLETAFKFAGAFGGGMRWGEVCGGATGALMAIGLKYGQASLEDVEAKATCGVKTAEFLERFKAEEGSILCRDILGYDVRQSQPPTMSSRDKTMICSKAIANAVKILEEMGF